MTGIKKNQALIISLITHTALFLLIVLHFTSSEIISQGETKSQTISSYVYQEKIMQRRSETSTRKIVKRAIATRKRQQTLIKPSQMTRPVESKSGNGKPISTLAAMLHKAIEEQQQYPASALALEREGKTTVMFILHPDGSIEKLRIIAGSGTPSLDEAAIMAVNNAAPFKGVGEYLREAQAYQITVSFELT